MTSAMTDGTSWWYFTDQASAMEAAAEITKLCGCLCQAGHVTDDTIAAPEIGHRDDAERRWVLVVPDHHDDADDDFAPCWLAAERRGGEYDTHESGWLPIPPDLRQMLPFPN
jgi:hypothetical protein